MYYESVIIQKNRILLYFENEVKELNNKYNNNNKKKKKKKNND